MKKVQKGNKQLRIEDAQLQNYLAKGYVELDKDGKPIVKEPEAKALKRRVAALEKENTALKEQLAALKQ